MIRTPIRPCSRKWRLFGQSQYPDAFPERLPADEAFLQALTYAERASIPALWIDDPGGDLPPEKRPARDVGEG